MQKYAYAIYYTKACNFIVQDRIESNMIIGVFFKKKSPHEEGREEDHG